MVVTAMIDKKAQKVSQSGCDICHAHDSIARKERLYTIDITAKL